jgi:hypothetical protein
VQSTDSIKKKCKSGKKRLRESSSSSDSLSSEKRKHIPNLSLRVTSLLKKWLLDNFDHPYPDEIDKEKLGLSTGLSRT